VSPLILLGSCFSTVSPLKVPCYICTRQACCIYLLSDDSLEDQKENLLGLIDSYPHGIALKCIHAAYGSKYEEDLQVRKYGYDSVRQFIESLSDDLEICEVGGEVFVKGKSFLIFVVVVDYTGAPLQFCYSLGLHIY